MTSLYALNGVIRPYAWGSRTAIPELLGVPPGAQPAAELWLGAHPDDPAQVVPGGLPLDAVLATDPGRLLGAESVAAFGPALPFLLKVLAAETALSIQVHPNLEQARAGFAAEDERGVPRDAPERNYRDANHKPELLCALTEFDALCGFRPAAATLRLLTALDVPELAPYARLLAGQDGLRATFTALLELAEARPLVDAVLAGATRLAGAGGEWADEAGAVIRLGEQYPGDTGSVLSLLLNLVRLRPGEAIFLAAGNVHAYLHGLGVEILANSDNVLRCGLTRKHVDVPELLRITDFRSLAEPRWPATDHDGQRVFHVPVPDFALALLELDGSAEFLPTGPQILLCTDGEVAVVAADERLVLPRGGAAFVAAGAGVSLSGKGALFRAYPNLR